ncbi:hypothetical protein [Corynebacterium macginleyi]|uniref:hypothetical protein n=1 Tax=Corynebacterium macginleyi TaxID=38290 RepID=UPI0019324051|nr:hypothetical protein [Corynebacterium macginleyi]
MSEPVVVADGSDEVGTVEEYSYSFPGVDAIVLDAETGVAFLFAYIEGEPELVGGVDAPWARDAKGVEVPTHFEVQGNVLTQVVEHKSGDFAYPITADPSWWDNVKGWFKSEGSWVVGKAKSAANWLGPKAKWLSGKSWSGTKWVAGKGKVVAKKSDLAHSCYALLELDGLGIGLMPPDGFGSEMRQRGVSCDEQATFSAGCCSDFLRSADVVDEDFTELGLLVGSLDWHCILDAPRFYRSKPKRR